MITFKANYDDGLTKGEKVFEAESLEQAFEIARLQVAGWDGQVTAVYKRASRLSLSIGKPRAPYEHRSEAGCLDGIQMSLITWLGKHSVHAPEDLPNSIWNRLNALANAYATSLEVIEDLAARGEEWKKKADEAEQERMVLRKTLGHNPDKLVLKDVVDLAVMFGDVFCELKRVHAFIGSDQTEAGARRAALIQQVQDRYYSGRPSTKTA